MNRSQELLVHPVILATWKAEIWRLTVKVLPRQVVLETPSPK
jgi:hypothetical protein